MAHQNSTSHRKTGSRRPPMKSNRLDPVLRDWIQIGSLAWSGHLAEGRGVVLATVTTEGVEYRYWAGVPCDCHAQWVDEYDPKEEAIVVVCRGDKESIYRIKASPKPPEAWARDISPRERRLAN